MNSWNIIGWLLLIFCIGLPVFGWILQRSGRTLMYLAQRRQNKPVEKYDRFESIWGGKTYRVNQATSTGLVVSSDPNNMGGFHISREEWAKTVRHGKLVRLNR